MGADLPNTQTAELFAAERAVIEEAAVPLTWLRPSDHDPDRLQAIEAITSLPAMRPRSACLSVQARAQCSPAQVDGRGADQRTRRGGGAVASGARELVAEVVLDPNDGDGHPDADEIAATAWRTLQLPGIAALHERLTPE
ncbi:hypothetical protein ACVI1L_004874 [Bradyrhizobium sp. USDA 4516]